MIIKNTKFGEVEYVTVCEFGTGDIEMTPTLKTNGRVFLAMKTTDEPHEIGIKRDGGYATTNDLKPEIVLSFDKIESIDAVISSLLDCKEELLKDEIELNK